VAPDFLPTAVLCDVVPQPIALLPRVRRVWRGATLAGPAVTVRTPPGQFASVRQALDLARAGDVIVVDAGGSLATALWGDRMSKLALERGVAGLVVDGAVRDADGIEELGFPVFAAGVVPTPPGRDVLGEVGVEIECAGRLVTPGDVVYGDGDGVVVVPAAIHDDVVVRARDAMAAEKA
jgi:4-hydroxy-4-methyl-2-oxoglutarate aldolase